jgi:4-hydroxy-2-oxoheptanedioate aldolase
MNPSRIRQKLASGQPAWCVKACYADPELVELVSTLGFDGIWICLEHKRLDPATTYSLIQACRLGGADAVMRVKPANHSDLAPLLESGAKAIMLPRVRGVEEVKEVVGWMKYPPVGRRGYDAIHADARFGLGSPKEYMEEANRETMLIVQIEEPEVISHLDAIAALPGVDVLFVGPADMSLGLGVFGQPDALELANVVKQVVDVCQRHGKVAGIPCAAAQAQRYYEMGYRFICVASDYHCLVNGFEKAKAEVGPIWDGKARGQG